MTHSKQTKQKEEYLKTRKCPKCNKDLSVMYGGELKTRVVCSCGFEVFYKNNTHKPKTKGNNCNCDYYLTDDNTKAHEPSCNFIEFNLGERIPLSECECMECMKDEYCQACEDFGHQKEDYE